MSTSAKPVFCVQEPIDTIYGHRCHRFHRVSQDGLEWDSSPDSVQVHTMTSTELHRLDSRTSDPSSNFAKLTCTGPKLNYNTYRTIFSTCQLIVCSFATTTCPLSLTSFQWLIPHFFPGKFIVSLMSLWHKHNCASWVWILISHLCHGTSIGPLNFSKLYIKLTVLLFFRHFKHTIQVKNKAKYKWGHTLMNKLRCLPVAFMIDL